MGKNTSFSCSFLAINSAKMFGIELPNQLKAKHLCDPNIEHISMMAYLTRFMPLSSIQDRFRIIGLNLNNVFVNKEVTIEVLVETVPFD